VTHAKTAIITLCTSSKSVCTYVEETILELLPKKTLTFYNFCIHYPNVAFFDALEFLFAYQQEKMNTFVPKTLNSNTL